MMTIHNYGNVYVKFIDFVANHPGCTWAEINSHVHPGKPVYTSRTEFTGLVPRYIKIASKRGRAFTYELTSSGQDILEQAKRTKWVFDFIDAIKSTNACKLDEVDVNLTLQGSHYFMEAPYLRKFLDLRNGYDWTTESMKIWSILKRRLPRGLFDAIVKKAEELNPDWTKKEQRVESRYA